MGTASAQGVQWDDISYVIGGAYKKSRYIDKKGFIITAAKDGSDLKTQFNLEDGTWSYYHKGEKKPYKCGPCHMTGYSPEGNQDGLEGMIGTWEADGIQCEECHGPGADHAASGDKSKIKVDGSSKACGKCHIRGTASKIPAKKGFIRHHEQYNELLASPHKTMDCVTCHDPHKRRDLGIKKSCGSCHEAYAKKKLAADCKECHMPRATKSAIKKGKYEGDIRTHVFSINTDPGASMFYTEESGGKKKTYAKGFVTLDFACLSCHKNKDINWAARMAPKIHGD